MINLLQHFEKLFNSGKYVEIIDQYDNNPVDIIKIQLIVIRALRYNGEMDRSLSMTEEIFTNNHHTEIELIALSIEKAYIKWHRGDFKLANTILKSLSHEIEQYQDSKDYFIASIIATYYHLLSNTRYLTLGYELTRVFILKSIEIRERIKDYKNLAVSYNNLGVSYKYTKNIDLAVDAFERSRTIHEKLNNDADIGLVLSNLIEIYMQTGNIDDLEKSIDSLNVIKEKHPNNKLINLYCNYNVASLYTIKNINWEKAEKLFYGIINDDIIHPQYYTNSIYRLCVLYINQMRSNKKDLLIEIHTLINKLIIVGYDQKSHNILLRAKLLQSQYLILKDKVDEAKELLEEINKEVLNVDEEIIKSLIVKEINHLKQNEEVFRRISDFAISDKLKIIHLDEILDKFLKFY